MFKIFKENYLFLKNVQKVFFCPIHVHYGMYMPNIYLLNNSRLRLFQKGDYQMYKLNGGFNSVRYYFNKNSNLVSASKIKTIYCFYSYLKVYSASKWLPMVYSMYIPKLLRTFYTNCLKKTHFHYPCCK